MSANPFAPPRAAIDDAPELAHRAMRKPASAWLLQIACTLAGLSAAWGLSAELEKASAQPAAAAAALVLAILVAMLLAWMLLAVWGTQVRAAHGRWLGAAFIGALFALGAWIIWLTYHAFDADSDGTLERGLVIVTGVLWLAAMTLWLRAFGFSRAARDWFAPRSLARSQAPDDQR